MRRRDETEGETKGTSTAMTFTSYNNDLSCINLSMLASFAGSNSCPHLLFGSADLHPFAPPASSRDPILAAWPMQMV